MRLPNQIRAVACAGWVSILGLGVYFAQSARPSRLGVIREGSAGTLRSDLGAQDAPTRPGNRQPTPGASLAAKAGSPGFASESSAWCAGRSGDCSSGFGDNGACCIHETRVARSQGVSLALPAQNSDYLRDAPGGHYLPYILTAYSAGCILPKFGPEPPPQPMASGAWPVAGLHVAADPSLAFGTVLEVVYRGLPSRLIVGDRGRAIRGRRLDLYVESCRAARAWGRRTAYVREVSE